MCVCMNCINNATANEYKSHVSTTERRALKEPTKHSIYTYMNFERICVYLSFVLQAFPVTATKAKLKLKYHSIGQLYGV